MPRGRSAYDPTTLQMALVGYEIQKHKIEDKIRELRAQLAGHGAGAVSAAPVEAKAGSRRRRRKLSAAARKRIAEAQRKRWAEHRKNQAGKS